MFVIISISVACFNHAKLLLKVKTSLLCFSVQLGKALVQSQCIFSFLLFLFFVLPLKIPKVSMWLPKLPISGLKVCGGGGWVVGVETYFSVQLRSS